jgi:hypothetical protein
MAIAAYKASEIAHVHDAYILAGEYFAGAYRPGWKPFVSHLVGIASVIVREAQASEIVSAAILHSLYVIGENPPRRTLVQRRVGGTVEALVNHYSSMSFLDLVSRPNSLSQTEAIILRLRLADIFDDLWDGGYHFGPKKAPPFGLPGDVDGRAKVIELANVVSAPRLALDFNELFQLLEQGADTSMPADQQHGSSFFVQRPKMSPAERLQKRLRRIWEQRT